MISSIMLDALQAERLERFKDEVEWVRNEWGSHLEREEIRWHHYELDGVLAHLQHPDNLTADDEYRVDMFITELVRIREVLAANKQCDRETARWIWRRIDEANRAFHHTLYPKRERKNLAAELYDYAGRPDVAY